MEDVAPELQPQQIDSKLRRNSSSAAADAVSQLLGMTGGLPDANGSDDPAQDHGSMHTSNNQPDAQPQAQHAPPPPPQHPVSYNGATPAATAGGGSSGLPTCQNCSTSTTPLWRRDEYGNVLCNACGLFLKLHGRPRPISLKTDVIKSRNRLKGTRSDAHGKKKATHQSNAAPRSANLHGDGANGSPISRTDTPSMYNNPLPSFMMDDPYSSNFGQTGDGSGSPMNGDTPQTHEQLIAANSSLKTRVRELELINELFRGRLSQLEQQEAAARRGHEVADSEQTGLRTQLEESRGSEAQLLAQLEETHRRENSLKRRLDELELELKAATATKTARDAEQALESQHDESERPSKKARTASPARGNESSSEEVTVSLPAEEETGQAPEPTMMVDTDA
ncbi:uncharacterized protein F5Z01DRAFT_641833 [Emericellopsis atlantica]|uniref:GATA-type domain-containing protein n=1 Tax=Emericellopsis atlantica TaxID=2614577 RepID=A0A9P7ZX06_9HYPO|nr:uncharacterized protein F5Z01DRAFT_641833 [Emericellopsis atlantica]KAG9258948.1 hypothetical protein F5Z01DRAFT_641833 [Emericellopsis atlantica]